MPQERIVVTTLRLQVPVWRELRRLAEEQALREGGRASTAAVVSRLIVEAAQQKPGEAA